MASRDDDRYVATKLEILTSRERRSSGVAPHVAPAGGVAAAAPEGGALACPSASPHLPVVGVGNPVAVLGLAR
jgi:hypothetical protein